MCWLTATVEKDQSLKLKVRDRVLGFLEENMPETDSAADAAAWVREHIDDIEKVSCDIVTAQGMHQTVSAAVTTCWFPDKSYGDVTLPAGNYEALRIELGVAKDITGGACCTQVCAFLTR